jgi:Kef-type K+ transport system membrane component KefB
MGESSGSIINGHNPIDGSPVALFLVQCVFIIICSRLLGALLARLKQPRVIAEVISGICLGPSVLGKIPGFTTAVFPKASLPALNMVSTRTLFDTYP